MPPSGAFDVYRDALGTPRLVESAVVLIDALGVSYMSRSPNRTAHLQRLNAAMAEAALRAHADAPQLLQASTWFTDNVVVGLPVGRYQSALTAVTNAVSTAAEILVGALLHGVLLRGGLAFGELHLAERFAFGPALIDAYDLEQDAGGPRILLCSVSAATEQQAINATAGTSAWEKTTAAPSHRARRPCLRQPLRRSV